MNTVDIITKKRNGHVLNDDEIQYIVTGFTNGSIPDYQMSAFLMAIYFQGMNHDETVKLTQIMRDSGDIVDLSDIEGIKVDKHSTGGVGDKTTLIVAPIAASCGVPIAKMSGRGLGFTGGTVDKLESISGYRTSLEREEFVNQVNNIGISVIGQTGHIAPADKKIYALRDVTGTVENLSLITSSIMSKKLAAGSDAIVLDVKCGKGAFMKDEESAAKLASLMVEIGNANGKKTMALITDMNEPLGNAIGNSLEVIEAIDTLKGQGPCDITELSIKLSAVMIYAGNCASTIEAAERMAQDAITSGKALNKLSEMIEAQGGNSQVINDYSLMPHCEDKYELKANRSGYIKCIDAMTVGLASQHTGAGRETKDDVINMGAGIYLHKKVGDLVNEDDVLAEIFTDKSCANNILAELGEAYEIVDETVEKSKLIRRRIL